MAPVMHVRDLVKRYGDFEAVRGVSFDVEAGTCVGLLGPNGAGKTSTMRMVMGLSAPSGGVLELFGVSVADLSRNDRARMALVPQEDNLDPDLTVYENLYVYGLLFGMEPAVLAERVPELLAYMQLSDKAKARVNQLSGGMKRRLTLARALVNDPDFLILDEPTTGLDPQARVMIWQKLVDLQKQGKTLLLTTHYMDEAQRLCKWIVVMDHGAILDEGSPADLIARHVPPHVFEFVKPLPKAVAAHVTLGAVESEDLGESLLFYVKDAPAFRAGIPDDGAYTHRMANLEDVFLRLTGRKLRE